MSGVDIETVDLVSSGCRQQDDELDQLGLNLLHGRRSCNCGTFDVH